MPHLYTTKSLGRTWKPTAPFSPSLPRGRYSSTPTSHAASTSHTARILRSRPVARFVILLALLGTCIVLRTSGQPAFPIETSLLSRWQGMRQGSLRWGGGTKWKDFAYVTYATTPQHLCNSVMVAESLWRLGVKPERLIMYTRDLTAAEDSVGPGANTRELLEKAERLYDARLQIVDAWQGDGDPTWVQSFTKLLAFNQTQYLRVLSLDSDATVLKSLDDLFLLPETAVAMPRAYWLEHELCSSMMLISPSAERFEMVKAQMAGRETEDYDMEIVNKLFGGECLVLPHRPYLLLSGEFRADNHTVYLGRDGGNVWSAAAALKEARYVHFSDHPLSKPWLPGGGKLEESVMPACRTRSKEAEWYLQMDCSDREAWLALYEDFRARRRRVCGDEFAVSWGREGDW